MCGRFAQHLTWRQIHALYQLPASARPLHLHPRYNGAPVQDFAVCRLDADRRWCAETSVRRGPGHRDGRRGMIST